MIKTFDLILYSLFIVEDGQVDLTREVGDTGDLIIFLDELRESLNSNQEISSKPLEGAVTRNPNMQNFGDKHLKWIIVFLIIVLKFFVHH